MLRPDGEIIDFFSGDLRTERGSLSSSCVLLTRQESPIRGLSSGSAGDFRPPGSSVRGLTFPLPP